MTNSERRDGAPNGPKPRDIASALALRVEDLAVHLMGEPTFRDRLHWRYGRRGSLAVVVLGENLGSWFDHERAEGGDALDLVRRERGGTMREAMDWALAWLGGSAPAALPARPALAPTVPPGAEARFDLAMRLWAEARPARNSPAGAYLTGRKVDLPTEAEAVIRHHPECPRGPERLPALVALITDPETAKPTGIHRIYLRIVGTTATKVEHGPVKLSLGGGGVVRLSPDDHVTTALGICEGIETGLSIRGMGWRPVWSCLSAGIIRTLPVLAGIEALNIFGDADYPDQRGRLAGQDAARECAARWAAAGREATIRLPNRAGTDWLDATVAP